VLRQIAKAIHHLHVHDIIHGNISIQTCGKFGPVYWKLMDVLGSKFSGEYFTQSRMNINSPPECIDLNSTALSTDI